MSLTVRLTRVLMPVLFLLVTGLLVSACSDKNADLIGSSGGKFISPNQIKTLDADTSQSIAISFQNFAIDTGVATGYLSRIGKEVSGGRTLTATTYLKFSGSFPSEALTSAKLVLTPTGETALTGNVTVNIYEVDGSWSASGMYSRKPIALKSTVLGSATVDVQSTTAIDINLSGLSSSNTNGLAIVTTSGSVMTTINTGSTKLHLETGASTTDLSVSEYAYTIAPATLSAYGSDAIYLQSVTGSRSQLKFDLSQLPRNAQVMNAELVLVRNPPFSPIIDTTKLVAVNYGGASLAISSTYSSVTASSDANQQKFTANVTKMVQSWAGKPANNNGFILTAASESSTLQAWKFYGSSAPVGQRPRLVVTYAVSQ